MKLTPEEKNIMRREFLSALRRERELSFGRFMLLILIINAALFGPIIWWILRAL